MSAPTTNIFRNQVTPVVVGCTGIGTSGSYIFQKLYEVHGAPGVLQLGLLNVVGTFTGLQFNLEWSPTNGSGTYFETVGSWTPLANGIGYFPISEAGFYRLNCTTFTGGTSVDVAANVALTGSAAAATGPSSDVTIVGATATVPVSIQGQPISVTGSFTFSASNVYKTYQSQGGTPGQQAIWTPASGKKFNLLQFWMTISGNATTSGGGLLTAYFTDGPAGPVVGPTMDFWIEPSVGINMTGNFEGFQANTGQIDLGAGYLSTTINNSLYLNTSLQLATGYIRVNTFGTEQ